MRASAAIHTEESSAEEASQEQQGQSESRGSPTLGSESVDKSQGKFMIRLPAGLLKEVSVISNRHQRSMNSEIILLLGRYLEEQGLVGTDAEEQESMHQRLLRKLNGMSPEKRAALLQLLE